MESQLLKSNTCKYQTPSLPQDIITSEILMKLPIRSLVRFKTVCKQWNIIISSSNFAKHHLMGHPMHEKTLFIRSNGSCNILDEKTCYEISNTKCFDNPREGSSIRVIGSCNGLVCLYFKLSNNFCVWNPCVNEYKRIIPFPQSVCFNAGFGFVSSSDDYMIFAIGLCLKPRERVAFVYSMKDDKWKKIVGHGYELAGYSMDGVLVDENLYWGCKKIVGFSLRECSFFEVSNTNLGNSFLCMGLCVLNGSLCVWDYVREGLGDVNCLDLDMFKYDSSCRSWTKMFRFDVSSMGLYVRGFFGYTASGKVLVQRNHDLEVEVFVCCPNRNLLNFVGLLVQGNGHVVRFKESLISPYHLQTGGNDE